MTSPVPDALRTQLAEVLRRHSIAAFNGTQVACSCDRRWRSTAVWRDHVSDALVEVNLLARARVEGAAEALREAADDTEAEGYATRPEIGSHGGGLLSAAEELRDRAAALSASTTTEGDPT